MLAELRAEALRFVMAHPGCVRIEQERMQYAQAWRSFVIAMVERHPEVPPSEPADALCMPLGTLEDWLRSPPAVEPADPANVEPGEDHERCAKLAQIEMVLDAWRMWRGDFL